MLVTEVGRCRVQVPMVAKAPLRWASDYPDTRMHMWCLRCKADKPIVQCQPDTSQVPWRYMCSVCQAFSCLDR